METDAGPLRKRLWDMLIHRCPKLEELSFEGDTFSFLQAHCLTQGRWPKLRSMTLGDIRVDYRPSLHSVDDKRPFIRFLEEHSGSLQKLALDRRNVDVESLRTLDASALCSVQSFSGTVAQLRALPQLHKQLKSVTFEQELVSTREITTDFLKHLSNIVEFSIMIPLQQSYETSNIFRGLITACPKLRRLKVICNHQPSMQFVSACIP
jgi:hypothetical protein